MQTSICVLNFESFCFFLQVELVSEETYLKCLNPYSIKKRKDWKGQVLTGQAAHDDLQKRGGASSSIANGVLEKINIKREPDI